MTRSNDAKRHPRRWLATLFALAAVGAAVPVIAINTSAGGSKPAGLRAARGHATPAVHAAAKPVTRAAKAPTPPPAAKPKPLIPQQNGGDADPDNNGGTDDADGNI